MSVVRLIELCRRKWWLKLLLLLLLLFSFLRVIRRKIFEAGCVMGPLNSTSLINYNSDYYGCWSIFSTLTILIATLNTISSRASWKMIRGGNLKKSLKKHLLTLHRKKILEAALVEKPLTKVSFFFFFSLIYISWKVQSFALEKIALSHSIRNIFHFVKKAILRVWQTRKVSSFANILVV